MLVRKLFTDLSVALMLASASQMASAQLGDLLKTLKLPSLNSGTASAAAGAALSNKDVIRGLKEALAKGAESAISSLGKADGFFGNGDVKIQLPSELEKLESLARSLGQGRYADEFQLTMNRAAEQAVPEASAIIGDAIREMSVKDAKKILNGPDDAATQYFRKVGEKRLTGKLRPIVEDATANAGVTRAYKGVVEKAGFAAKLLGNEEPDLDGYVTAKTLDGLFLMIAAEEKRIRDNPAARSTDLLKKVFGSVGR